MRFYFAGGLNEQQTPNILECGEGYNFELGLRQSKMVRRAPIDLLGTATNAAEINGFMQLVQRDNSETTLVQSGDTVYLWDGASSFTSKGTVNASSMLRGTYWSLGEYLVVTDIAKATVVKKWDGTTFGTLTTGLGTNLYAKYGLVFNNRMWLFNVTTSSATPHLMVASAFENPQSYDTSNRGGPTTSGGGTFTTGQEAFYMLTPDLKPINGACVFYNQLIISTTGGRLFKLTGSTAATYAWTDFYPGSSAIGTESIANIGNDVIYMKEGGGIDLLSSTQNSGDVATDDVSRWIPETVADLTDAITVYDQKNQKVLFFVDGKVLVLYKDLVGAELSPWSVYKTQQTFAFNTNAAIYMKRPGTQVYSVFLGDSVGRIFDLYGSGSSGDAGASTIQVLRKTRYIYDGEGGDKNGHGAIDTKRKIMHGTIQYRRIDTGCDCTVSFDWGDEYNISSSVIPLKGAPTAYVGNYWGGGSYWGDSSTYWSEGGAFRLKISNQTFSPTGKGPGFFLSVSFDTNTEFQVDSIDLQPPAR